MTDPQSRRLLGVLCGMGAGALWGLVFLSPKLVAEASPALMSAGRYVAYGIIAALLIAPRWRRLTSAVDRAGWRGLVELSLTGNLVYYALLVVSVHYAGVAASALIVGMVPVVVTLWGLKDPGAAPLRKLAAPLLLAVAAVGLIGFESLSHQAASADGEGRFDVVIGLACALGALVSWSAYAVSNSRWLGRLKTVSAHDWSLLTGVVTGGLSLLLVPVAVMTAPDGWDGPQWGPFLAVSAGTAIAASILGNALWNQASRMMPLTMLGQMIIFETLFAFLYGYLWEARWPTPLEVAAIALMVISVLWCVRAHAPEAEPALDAER
jgi:drug/metabolite transporter (DMT)-like permease